MNALEYLFHSKALEAERFEVTNKQPTANQKSDYETDSDFYNGIFEKVNLLLNCIYRGHRVFNKKSTAKAKEETEIFFFDSIGCEGKLIKVDEGWLLLKGSKAIERDYRASINDPTAIKSITYARAYLSGKLDSDLRTTEDILFNSPSTPAEALCLQTRNGWVAWKDSKGQLLEKHTELRER